MRILFVTLEVFGGAKKGGGERYVTELARAARNRGLTVDVVVVRSLREFAELGDLDEPAHAISFWNFVTRVRTCDVVHVHQLNTPGFDYSVILAKLFRKLLVLTDHGGGVLTPGRVLGRARLRMLDAAAFVSDWSRQDVDPRGLVARHAIILGGGNHLPEAQPLKRRYDFGFVGRLIPHKGAHIAIEALPEGRSLIIAGQAREAKYFEVLKQLAAGKDVTFVSDASDAMVANLHKSVNYLLVPSVDKYGNQTFSRPELLGIVALEALAAGTPVIGSNLGGLGEVLKLAGQQAVTPGDVGEWRHALILSDGISPEQLRCADFTWDAVAQRCEELYSRARSHI
ncbi:glycosyltransferase family 4 protein [Agrobacterium larrymoorei]|uniref:Glycosyltransferase involved in cell wall biosynthesis n=1 Tax=Agrobacterium larrymoorei TaxID=160699 RepID=A0ABU0UGZ5_9HYPH|nr:glycosyltransferase family 4 protein [Agrobacterium larrymoorei]MDQ1184133.1 glycosyltransferase involved in cell wall biosynthesis [Agrobacterium larrymoorei]